MTRVYVSSTYEDLKDLRARVIEAIHELPYYSPVHMETYAADTRPAVEKCLKDARDCDVYLGILGSRAGYVPPGYDNAITRLEYEAAWGQKRPCLFFLLREQYSDNPKDAQDVVRIKEFREVVRKRHTCKIVRDEKAIGVHVVAGLFAEAKVREQARWPPLLPYACDRLLQQQDLKLALRDWSVRAEPAARTGPPSIPLCVIHGAPEQAPEKFVEWLGERLLKRILVSEELTELKVAWPRNTESDEKFHELLALNFVEAAQLRADTQRSLLFAGLAEQYDAFYISTRLSLDHWQKDEKARLVAFHDFFMGCEGTSNPPRAVVVWVRYKESQRRWWMLGRDRTSEKNELVRKTLNDFVHARPTAKLVTELRNVEEDEAVSWGEHPEVVSLRGHHDIEDLVRGIFRRLGRDSLEMKPLARELEGLLSEVTRGE